MQHQPLGHTPRRHSHTPPPSFPHSSTVIPTLLHRHSRTPPPSFPHPSTVIPAPPRRHSRTPPPSFPHSSTVIPAPLRRHSHTPPPSFPHPSAVIPTLLHRHSRTPPLSFPQSLSGNPYWIMPTLIRLTQTEFPLIKPAPAGCKQGTAGMTAGGRNTDFLG